MPALSREYFHSEASPREHFLYGEAVIHSNTIENYFSMYKSGMKGFCIVAPRDICIATLTLISSTIGELASACDKEGANEAYRGIVGKILLYRE
ncbi:hypothetical protein EOS93_06035 [Rhizobium sp. RMa-01]|uniref:hypothetical protein n=1 Tax=unclassified Rhizobium TaxID=2613769 RepID=UPI0008DA07D6|nr:MULTISPECIES: hypothetical protein [unclassified Rhizobium]OHV26951.1 hypothetical protein BBJ66_02835 [Rhizobium sp. RSm-3]RVU12224.1 hypothetical protein EOS93_06035 [Rhizobium sp. RMa-01]